MRQAEAEDSTDKEVASQEHPHVVQDSRAEVVVSSESTESLQETLSKILEVDRPPRPQAPVGTLPLLRFYAQRFVSNPWFDGFILSLILINSALLALYQYRDPYCQFNRISDTVIDPILLGFFTLECVLKVLAWGLVCAISQNNLAYLCDAWNWLDFVVVVTGWISLLADGGGLAFLRVFRVLRPLRSLTMLPEMRVLVNTVLKSIPRLLNVTLMGLFIFTVFAIIGVTLWGGIFYRQCRSISAPMLSYHMDCWIWNVSNPDYLCGGRFQCPSGSWCGGHPDDANTDFRPLFNGTADGHMGLPWCDNPTSDIRNPSKVFPETDFIHFDHIGGAMLIIFQSMTMEGWVDIMYWVQDSSSDVIATIYFFMVILMTSFFVLNVILAVIAEALDDEEEEAEKEEESGRRSMMMASEHASAMEISSVAESVETEETNEESGCWEDGTDTKDDGRSSSSRRHQTSTTLSGVIESLSEYESRKKGRCCSICSRRKERVVPVSDGEPAKLIIKDNDNDLWLNCAIVKWAFWLAESEVCKYVILFFIAANVVVMMMDKFPPDLFLKEFTDNCEIAFLTVFGAEMVMMIIAVGPIGYMKNPLTCFDGVIVLSSFAELAMTDGGALSVFRTFRLLRVVFKIANRWKAFRVLLKSIVKTIFSLGYFALLFLLVMYVLTLMAMQFFATKFHFNDDHSGVLDAGGPTRPWCPGPGQNIDCVPRANFDTFPWAFTTIFQIMSGENWNTVMYDSMRAGPWLLGASFFVFIIVFGQIMMLNLFLTILMNKFQEASDALDVEEKSKQERKRDAKAKADKAKFELKAEELSQRDGSFSAKMACLAFTETSSSKDKPIGKPDAALETSLPGQVQRTSLPGEVQRTQTEEVAKDPPLDEDEMQEAASGSQQHKLDGESQQSPDAVEKLALDILMAEDGGAPATAAKSIDFHRSLTQVKRDKWPDAYSFLVFHRDNPVRKFCSRVVEHKAFENFILVCILFSSAIMAAGSPLLDPQDTSTKVMKVFDKTFAVIFILEMFMKLVAMGLFIGPNTYLHNAWNWIDGVVVVVSIIDMTSNSSAGFLKTLRILRAFRPLRVISRNQNLKVVVTTIFKSLPELAMYLAVFMLFLLIVALLFLAYLNGLFYACSASPGDNMAMGENMGELFTTPLCLSPAGNRVCPFGAFDGNDHWNQSATGCSSCHGGLTNVTWTRPSSDTPICVGRCSSLQLSTEQPPPAHLCPPAPTLSEQLPSVCPNGELNLIPTPGKYLEAEKVGVRYVEAYMKEHVVPCGGPLAGAGCRDLFCPHKRGQPASGSCKSECKKHPSFCASTCGLNKNSVACLECLGECEAWCECQDYCEPLIKDAALCVEQGERWGQSISQNFNTIANSLTTLFEISTTEGWVDVMYEAVDAQGKHYQQPIRDSNLFWAFAFTLFIFFSNMFFLNLSVGVIVEQFLKIKKEAKMVNDDGAEVHEDDCGRCYCGRPLSKCGPMDPAGHAIGKGHAIAADGRLVYPASVAGPSPPVVKSPTGLSGSKKGPACRPDEQCGSCLIFTPDPTLTAKQAMWVESRKSLHCRTEPFPLTNLHRVSPMQRKAFLLISDAPFENGIMLAIVLNTVLMACQAFPQPTPWWDEFKLACGYLFAVIFSVEFALKMFALRRNYWKDPWNLFDFFCVVATFVGMALNMAGVGLGAVMSVIRIFRVARLFRLLRFMKGVNKIFMALVYSLPKLANVSILLVLMLILYGILGVQLFAKNKLSDSVDFHGNFQNFPRAFITLFRAMTGEAWNEMMHDLAKDERDYLTPIVGTPKSWCSDAKFWDMDSVENYKILQDKCMIEHPNACIEYPLFAKIYFITFCLGITFMVLNLVIAVILEGYEDGKEHTEGEVIDTCIKMWKKYDRNYTMFIPFTEAFQYADEVLRNCSQGAQVDAIQTPNLRPSAGNQSGMDLACVPMKYAQAFDLQMTEDGLVHFVPVVKLVLRFMVTNNDPWSLHEIEEADSCLSKKDKDKLERMEAKQKLKNRATITDSLSLMEQVAASKIQRRFKRKKENEARRLSAAGGIDRRVDLHPSNEEPLIAESLSSTPVMAPEMPSDWRAAPPTEPVELGGEPTSPDGSTSVARYSLRSQDFRRLEPRNPADVDGLDEPGRWAQGLRPADVEQGAAPEEVLRPGGDPPGTPSRDMMLNPPPGG